VPEADILTGYLATLQRGFWQPYNAEPLKL